MFIYLGKVLNEDIVMASGWTDERTELAQDMWRRGHTAKYIATILHNIGFFGVTRNSVISKMHRTNTRQLRIGNLSETKSVDERIRKKTEKIKANKFPPIVKEPIESRVIPEHYDGNNLPVKMMDLTDDMCRWPIGDPYDPSFAYCGCKKVKGPYCKRHAEIAYIGFKKAKAA